MKNRSLYAVLTRFGIVAAVLTALLVIAPVGAQEAEDPACKVNDDGVLECDYDENGTDSVATFEASDPEGQGIEWDVEGVDLGAFTIEGGVLAFAKSPDYETPGDMPRAEDTTVTPAIPEETVDNVYKVTVVAIEMLAEGQDPPAERNTLDVEVTVNNVDEDGMITLDRLQTRVEATGDGVTATLTDPDTRDAQGQTVDVETGAVWEWSVPKVNRPVLTNDDHWTAAGDGQSNAAADYTPAANDADEYLRVKATYTDGHGAMKTAYARTANSVVAVLGDATNNEPDFDETIVSFEIAEDAAVDAVVGTVKATDDDASDILSHVLTAQGASADKFEIDIATGEITVAAGLNHEDTQLTGGAYTVTVTAYDPSNVASSPAATVTITATDVNEAPGVADSSPDENLEVEENHLVETDDGDPAIIIGTYAPTDQDAGDAPNGDDAPELSLGGEDMGAFSLADNGALTFKSSPNFEKPTDANMDNTYKVSIVATDDDGLTGMKALSIKVTNMQELGMVSILPVQPAIGRAVTATLTDEDGEIAGAEWQWSSSSTGAANSFNDIVDATSSSYTPRPEIKDVDTTDADESYDGDEGMFLQATVIYKDKATLEDDDNPDTTADAAATVMEQTDHAVRAVPEVNNAPVFESATTMREVNENETVNAGDAVAATDADGDVLTYTLSGGADMDAFGINDTSGQITVGSDTKLDFEGEQRSYEVEVTATDPFGESGSTMVTIMVANVNEMPDFEADDPDDYEENGTGPVATFTATDPEGADVEWSISGLDNGAFKIGKGTGVLEFSKSPDYESPTDMERDNDTDTDDVDESEAADDNQYLLMVTATEVRPEGSDEKAESTSLAIAVKVTNVEEAGTITLTRLQSRVAATGQTASLEDPDGPVGDAQDIVETWLWSVPKVSRPVMNNDDHWTPAGGTTDAAAYAAVEADAGEVLRVKASYTDGEGADKETYATTAHPVAEARDAGDNEDPAFGDQVTTEFEIPENAEVGTVVGTVKGSDDDSADILSHVLTAAGASAGKFKIDIATGVITVAAALNHEDEDLTAGEYRVTVMVYDPSNDSGGENNNVSITATDVNEAPNEPTGTDEMSSVVENHAVMDDDTASPGVVAVVLGTYAVTDQDAADQDPNDLPELSLGGEDMGAFTLSDTGELTFKASPDFESPTDANGDSAYKVSIVATDNDGLTSMKDLTIMVENEDEVGSIKLSTIQPAVGREVTATLIDEDDRITGAKWQWYATDTKPVDGNDDGVDITAADLSDTDKIEGATSTSYTPKARVPAVEDDPATDADESAAAVPGDEGMFLVATVSYRDTASPTVDVANTEADESKVDNQHLAMTTDNAVREVPATNSAPDFGSDPITREVAENTAAGENVGAAVTAMDADGDVLNYTLSGGADMGSFGINSGTGHILTKAELDFEGDQTTYMVEVTATDPFDMSGSAMVTIMVTDKNEMPSLGLFTPPVAPVENVAPAFADDAATFMVYENMDVGSAVGMVEAMDEGDTLMYSDDSMYFDVDDMGNITTAMMLDHEAMASHMVMVTATDDDADDPLSDSIAVTVNVGNVEECEDVGATAVADRTNVGAMSDCEALLASRDALMGDDATRMLNWSADTPIADWYGVRRLSASGRVEWLYLHGVSSKDATDDAPARAEVKLNGTIPAELGGLTEMTRLYLHRNNLAGEIPAELNGLTNLVWLRLYDNDLSGVVPDLTGMTSLERFYVHQNDLTGGVPTKLSDSVTHILVHRNMLTGDIPDLSGMTNLVWLGLYDNMLSGEIPATVGGIAKLERLYLHGNALTGAVPMEIGNLASLTNLWLENNMLSGELPSSLNDLTNLERVQIIGGDNIFTGCIPAALANAATTDALETGLDVCP